ncbi:deoxyribodipyrimidine photo-lyase [Psychromonas sp. psych-6C06]|uniref:deoxyribodipyrimidine photo-lyase n=1 Tax=Psychromonas sp. psych-6C06 TaxID=2058089 RepID=UPI000C335FBC|nr:deoxyribodipyrimidine photo-lyase [Psychromonas sp. psych-6C06]PKF63352.1 deoxyribodipyrimidine photo-lyase [Psychromonas sp. psych-6C06]
MELVWFRKDLRINDNPALYQSCLNGPTTAIYFITPEQWQQHDVAPIQIDLMQRALNHLSVQLGKLGIALQVIEVNSFVDIPARLVAYCKQNNIGNVYANSEVEVDEITRDIQSQQVLSEAQIGFNLYQADCLINPGEVVTKQGDMYKVFTPFKNCCLKMLRQEVNLHPYPAPVIQGAPIENPDILLPLDKINSSAWPASEEEAYQSLQKFINLHVEDYHEQRDFPALSATSKLGPCLALGIISAKQCVYYLLQAFPTLLDGNATGPVVWLNEILWREFYRHIMVLNPHIGKGANYNPKAKNIIWNNNDEDFVAWCAGKTGYPLVDAAMRQLNETGWMHNRLRMVCASFLTKHLLIDWRWGEKYFKQHLIDGDFASNNGGWQWAASTGCDAQPYFRIFNPTLQSKKFDPNGEFIRIYLQQRQGINSKQLHEPIKPIVEHKFARQRALLSFSVLKAQEHQGG